jgi:phosphate transport system protein
MPPPLLRQLGQLAELLHEMCIEAATALRGATAGLVDGRTRLAEKIASGDRAMPRLRADVEQVATDALVCHAPVAGDLRAVVAAIRSADDLERMAVLARHVAEAALRRPGTLPSEVRPTFGEMSRIGVGMALKAAEVVRSRNVLLAAELERDDEAMDALHARMFEVLLDRSWPHGVATAVDVTLLARYYERFADHAVLVAGETVVAVTGRRPRDLGDLLRSAVAIGDGERPPPAGPPEWREWRDDKEYCRTPRSPR